MGFVTKILTSSFLTDVQRPTVLERTSTALSALQTAGNPAYANLLSICAGGPALSVSTPAPAQPPYRATPRASPQPRSSPSWGSPPSLRGSPYAPPRGLGMMASPPPPPHFMMGSPPPQPGYHLMSPYLGMYGPPPQQQHYPYGQRMSPQMAHAYQRA